MSLHRRILATLPFLFAGLIVLVVSLNVLSQADPMRTFPSLDSGYYLYFGQQILQGKTPYLDLWEGKPPGIFYINALGLLLGRGTRWGIWMLELVFLLISAGLGFYAIWRLYGFFPALFGSIIWLWGIQGVLQGGNMTEEFALPFNFAAVLFFILAIQAPQKRTYPFLMGISFALSLLLRPNNATVHVAIAFAWLVFLVLQRSSIRLFLFRLRWSFFGALLIIGALSLFLLASRNLLEMLEAAFFFSFYMTEDRAGFFSSLRAGLTYIGIPAGFALLGYLLLAFLADKRQEWDLFLVFLLPVDVLFSGLSGRGYPHYYITWMPALAFLSAHLLAGIPKLCAAFQARQSRVVIATLIFLSVFLVSPLQDLFFSLRHVATNRQQGVQMDSPIAAYLRQNTAPNDFVLVWGGRLVYNYLSHRESPSAILFNYPLMVETPISDRLSDRFLDEVKSKPPAIIVDGYAINQDFVPSLDPKTRLEQESGDRLWKPMPYNIEQFYQFVQENYIPEIEIDGVQLYRLVNP
jgi:hypothetical protein